MKIPFLKKIKSLESGYSKPVSETGFKPAFLWNILLVAYFSIGVLVFVAIVLSYSFLTREREGNINEAQSQTPRINSAKLDKIQEYFRAREEKRASVDSKIIIDPSKN